MLHGALALLALLTVAQADVSDGAFPELSASQQKKWHEYYAQQASSYEIHLSDDNRTLLELKPNSVLYWSNPVRIGQTNGAVFIWTRAGRAEVVGTVFSFLDRKDVQTRIIAHSFHSLSLQAAAAKRAGDESWSISTAGIDAKVIPHASPPARTPSARLVQMRELARDFSATTIQDGVERDLRLLTQPIHRQEGTSTDVLDGSLFTFVMGTDPELMLLIEAREAANQLSWHYAAARFTDLTIKLSHQGLLVWSFERDRVAPGVASTYVTGRIGKHPHVIE